MHLPQATTSWSRDLSLSSAVFMAHISLCLPWSNSRRIVSLLRLRFLTPFYFFHNDYYVPACVCVCMRALASQPEYEASVCVCACVCVYLCAWIIYNVGYHYSVFDSVTFVLFFSLLVSVQHCQSYQRCCTWTRTSQYPFIEIPFIIV